MIGIRGSGKVSLVAGITVRRRSCKDIVDVALIACNRRMRTGEREGRVVVIERGASP
jgi:hypothetical protein